MAQAVLFTAVGSIDVEKDGEYSVADLPTFPTGINAVRIVEAPLIWRAVYEQNGDRVLENGIPKYVKGNQRGVRILITRDTTVYPSPNVPALYKEGEEIALDANNSYKFLNDCVVEYGIRT